MASVGNRLSNTFRQLRWRLTLSYTAVTLGTLLVSLLIVAVLVFSAIFLPYDQAPREMWVQAADEQAVPLARMLLSESPPNTAGIADLVNYSHAAKLEDLDLFSIGNITLYARATSALEMLVFDPQGLLLGRTGHPPFPSSGQPFDVQSVSRLEPPLRAALAGEREATRLVSAGGPGQEWVVAVPVFGSGQREGELLGAVAYVIESMPTEGEIAPHTLGLLASSLVLFLLGAGIVGTLFGFLTASGMVRRFRRLSSASEAWSRGDFSELIDDPAGDEIGQLAHRLNSMAEQLQNLLKRRQAMAISEERNRLARDLHDSAKQQALAASFQLGTAITLFERDPQSANKHLVEAESLVDSVRAELTDLIHELRPPAMNGRDLAETLNE
jgi:signal transduction histidine kinase